MDLEILAEIPIDPEFAKLCDEGRIELYNKINFSFDEKFSNKILKTIGGMKK